MASSSSFFMPCSNFRLGATVILHYLSRKLEAARKRFLANAFPDLDLNCRQDDEPLLHRAPSQISEELEHDPEKRVPVFRKIMLKQKDSAGRPALNQINEETP